MGSLSALLIGDKGDKCEEDGVILTLFFIITFAVHVACVQFFFQPVELCQVHL